MLDRSHFEALDEADPLTFLAARFSLPEGLVYLDGNSLGPLPVHVPDVLEDLVLRQWGRDLITSWDGNGWWGLAERVGDKIAPLIGADPGSVIAGDTTTVAVYKAVHAAADMRLHRSTILTDSGNFPTDIYTMGAIASQTDRRLVVVESDQVLSELDETVGVVCLTHVDYRSGRRHDMAGVTEAAHEVGAVVVWDLSHSVGAMDLELGDADMAVGCGYKYLNGGPGAPAFAYVRPDLWDHFVNPLAGWWGHADPFAMRADFEPAPGRRRALVGTQPILSMAALDSALDSFAGVDTALLRAKSELLTTNFIDLVDEMLPEFEVVTPRAVSARGSQVSLAHDRAPAIMSALIDRGVIGDVRPPNLLRFGFGPAFQHHVDVWDAVHELRRVMDEDVM
ncbi:MAG: kynureninase [Acidimicrobiia bacterium]